MFKVKFNVTDKSFLGGFTGGWPEEGDEFEPIDQIEGNIIKDVKREIEELKKVGNHNRINILRSYLDRQKQFVQEEDLANWEAENKFEGGEGRTLDVEYRGIHLSTMDKFFCAFGTYKANDPYLYNKLNILPMYHKLFEDRFTIQEAQAIHPTVLYYDPKLADVLEPYKHIGPGYDPYKEPRPVDFSFEKNTINSILPYNEEKGNVTKYIHDLYLDIHLGQRKLLISEIQFLNSQLSSYDEEAVLIYAGAAAGFHDWYLHYMFPNVKFVLVDPHEFYLYINRYDHSQYHPENRDTGKYVYLSYTDDSRYSIGNRPKGILYYDPSTKKVEYIRHKTGKPATDIKRDVKKPDSEINRMSPVAGVESFKYCLQDKKARFYFCEEYMTTDFAKWFRQAADEIGYTKKILFCSDIRSNIFSNEHPGDLDILWNNAMTYSWLRLLKPDYSMLKFRPMMLEGIKLNYSLFQSDFDEAKSLGLDMVDFFEKNNNLIFFEGKIYIQAWKSWMSLESRLYVAKETILDNKVCEYRLDIFEQSFSFYNMINRFGLVHENPYSDRDLGFDNCNDCSIECYVLREYFTKFGNHICDSRSEGDFVKFNVFNITRIIGRRLGYPALFKPIAYGPNKLPVNEKIKINHGFMFKDRPNIIDKAAEAGCIDGETPPKLPDSAYINTPGEGKGKRFKQKK